VHACHSSQRGVEVCWGGAAAVAFVPGGRRLVVLDRLWVSSSIENLRVQVVESPKPYTLHPTPHTLHPTPYTLRATPYTLHPKLRVQVVESMFTKLLVSGVCGLGSRARGGRGSEI
jgi:hypothetical protein